jgi:23S rRNA (pseudouridine1915-N3)-methyltransferase
MKIQLITVGGLKQEYAQIGCALFEKRLRHQCRFELIEVKDAKRSKRGDVAQWKAQEAHHIQDALGTSAYWVALDEKGASWTSVDLSKKIEWAQNQSFSKLTFVIGGPDGLDSQLLANAPQKLALGSLTLPHELARLILLEQLYRAHSILENSPYHRI